MSESLPESSRVQNNIDSEALDLFWWFIQERQAVWHRRVVEGREPPWTDDEILQDYRFTNVYRELDPGTQYVIQNILEADTSRSDKVFNVMLYRLIGRLETHEFLGLQTLCSFDAQEFRDQLKQRRDTHNEPVFTGAYMVSGYNHMGSSDKIENVAAIFDDIASDRAFFDRLLATSSMKEAYELIRTRPGFGNFLSYQVLVDLLYPVDSYNGRSMLPHSPNSWSAPGPGAQKGIARLVKNFDGFDQLDVMQWLQRNQEQEFERLDLNFLYLETESGDRHELSLANIQNCLCEFYKYDKILSSDGRARRRFRESGARSEEELRSIYARAPHLNFP